MRPPSECAWLLSLLTPCSSAGLAVGGVSELPEAGGEGARAGPEVLGAHTSSPSTKLTGRRDSTACFLGLSTAPGKCQRPIDLLKASAETVPSTFQDKLLSVFCLEGRRVVLVTTVSATVVNSGHLPCMLPNENTFHRSPLPPAVFYRWAISQPYRQKQETVTEMQK